ncbi:hypothetical protein F5H01DRAFT_385355 [Linnemannia elongata]|nr:hypothetical protein F5H01DRAFT_385478 [Linnemannia elongata]KAK5797018.1 hypothetical protein F5H01DRAFT_385355 [Linnemannia elongata]
MSNKFYIFRDAALSPGLPEPVPSPSMDIVKRFKTIAEIEYTSDFHFHDDIRLTLGFTSRAPSLTSPSFSTLSATTSRSLTFQSFCKSPIPGETFSGRKSLNMSGWFLNNLKPCTKLSELHCADLENLLKPPKTNPVALSPIVDQTNNPLLMIGANPNLHTLTFEKINWQYRADHFTESVFRFLVTHKSLTRLKLHLAAIPHSFLNNFFDSLPVSLQDLEFRFETFYHTPLAREFRTPADFRTTPLPCLKRLCLPGKRQRVTSH